MRVPLARYGWREVKGLSVLFAAATAAGLLLWWPAAVVLAALWLAVLAFFRDPERKAGCAPEDLVSPADGKVRDVAEVEQAPFVEGRSVRIGIFMSILDVHVNRSPADAWVRWVSHRPGRFHDARNGAAAAENERSFLGLELQDGRRILVSQIAGRVARRIVCAASVGDALTKGQRFGMVKLGSRVELYLPCADQYSVAVRPGDRVRAGRSVLASRSPQPGEPAP